MIIPIPRNEARLRGLLHFYTGKHCKHGHNAARTTSNGACVECNNRLSKETYARNKVEVGKKQQAYAAGRKDQRREYFQAWLTAPKLAAIRERAMQWRRDNSERHGISRKAALLKRRAAKRQRVPTWYGELDALVNHEAACLIKARRHATGIQWDVDHMIPLQARTASGLHCAANLQVIPQALNKRKGNRLWLTEPLEWLKFI